MKKIVFASILTLGVLFIAALLFAGFNSGPLTSKSTSAKVAMAQLASACEGFFEEHQSLPLAGVSISDSERITTGKDQNIMPPLCIPSRGGESSKHQTFFEYKKAREKNDSLLRKNENTELFDPWGSPYHVLFDYDYDRELKDPFTGEILTDKQILIWSPGPDQQSGNSDDIRSWN